MNEDRNTTAETKECGGRGISASGGAAPFRRKRRVGLAFNLSGTLVLDGKRVPAGPCWVRQAAGKTALSWTEADGSEKAREISHLVFRQLLDEGLLQRRDGG